jgi:hypothetical protein
MICSRLSFVLCTIFLVVCGGSNRISLNLLNGICNWEPRRRLESPIFFFLFWLIWIMRLRKTPRDFEKYFESWEVKKKSSIWTFLDKTGSFWVQNNQRKFFDLFEVMKIWETKRDFGKYFESWEIRKKASMC